MILCLCYYGPVCSWSHRAMKWRTIECTRITRAQLCWQTTGSLQAERLRSILTSDFFVTDRLARKDISMEYCLTAYMYGDFYTNPTQGRLYKTERQAIMNLQSNNINEYIPEGSNKLASPECVGTNHPNRNKVASTQTGKHKCKNRSRNALTYVQAVISGHRRWVSEVRY